MNIKRSVSFSIFIMMLIPLFNLANQEKSQESETTNIPGKVKAIFQQGMLDREIREDIHFEVIEHLYMPYRENMFNIFAFEVKNSDLGYSSLTQSLSELEGEKQEEESAPAPLRAQANIFVQFNKITDEETEKKATEVYVPVNVSIDSDSYLPDKREIYTFGYPLSPGQYLLSMAITSKDLEKIGTQYVEFSVPDPTSYTDKLGTSSIFFTEKIETMPSPETTVEAHKQFFTYNYIHITPNLKHSLAPGENLDVFFYIFGTHPDEEGKYDIEIKYNILEKEEPIIKYIARYDNPLISQPILLKKKVVIQTKKEGKMKEREIERNLDPGDYTLVIDIKDNISGKTVKKKVDFKIKNLE
ncbi:MAG: hypothetical protein ACOC6P_01580 [Candidatus Aminicenantaceae bacterium]